MQQFLNPMTPAKMYGELFSMMADEISCIKQRAVDLYREALAANVDPAEMDADMSLLELDLAVETDLISFSGIPTVEYLDLSEGTCTCEEDDDE